MTSCPASSTGKTAAFTALTLSALVVLPSLCLAEAVATTEWNITADRIIRYEDPNSIVAEGNIILEKRVKLPPATQKARQSQSNWSDLLEEPPAKMTLTAGEVDSSVDSEDRYIIAAVIKADWLSYDMDRQLIKARGNVRLADDEDTLVAEKASVDLNTETGSFSDAVIIRKENQLHLEGKTIEKTGLNTYHIEDGWVVTCKVDPGQTPPWSFASADTTITEGGYAVMHHATFNIKGVPVFYTPYMIVPVKNTRQTGLLLPELSSSVNGGFGINVPFFVNISDSIDLTLFPEAYIDRGIMPGFEFRAVRDEDSKGALMGSYLQDDLSGTDQTTDYYTSTGFTHTNSDRYWLRGKADHNEGDWQSRLDLDIVSDRDYLTEFDSGYTGFSSTDSRFLDTFGRGFDNKTEDTRQNALSALKSWQGMYLQTDLLGFNDVRDRSTKASEVDPLWTLPQVSFSGVLPIAKTGAAFNWETEYVNYWREDGIGGNRVDLHPSISSTVPLSPYLESRAELGLRETLYMIQEYGDGQWNNDSGQNRATGDFEFEVASPLMRSFALSSAAMDTLDHRVRPFIRYNFIPDVNQEDLPFFDSTDLIEEQNRITYGVDNFFSGFLNQSERDLGYVKIFQSYSLLDEDSDEQFSDLTLRIGATPLERLYLEYETDYNVHGQGFVRHSFEGYYSNSRGDLFAVDYSFNDTVDVIEQIEQINALVRTRLMTQWYTQIGVEHSLAEHETNEANLSLLYTAPCWSIEFKSQYTPSDTRFLMVFNLANIGSPIAFGM